MTLSVRRVVWIFGVLGIGAIFSAPALAQPLSADQIVAETKAKYAILWSYSDEGEVSASTAQNGSTSFSSSTHFKISLARPGMYSVAWSQSMGFMSMNGAVWSDGQHRSFASMNQVLHPLDDETAIASATGVSGGAAHTVPTLFLGDRFGSLPGHFVLKGEEQIEGDDCYVLTSTLPSSVQTVWISKASKLVRRHARVSEGTDPPLVELSEDAARRVLVRMGEEATPEAVQRLLDLPTKSRPSLKGKTFTSVETHRNIRLDEPLAQADFQDEMKIQ